MKNYNKIMELATEDFTALEAELNEEISCLEERPEDKDLNLEDTFAMFLRDIAQYKQLTSEEELELGAKVQAGGPDAQAAREKMINANYKLVVYIAKKYAKAAPMDIMDLVMNGIEGLMHAVDRYNPAKGFRFSTYACWWIRQAITRGIANEGYAIRIPVNNSERYDVVSLDAAVAEGSDTAYVDMIPDDNSADPYECCEKQSLREAIDKALTVLTDKEALVVKYRNGIVDGRRYTLDEIGKLDEFQVSRERIRQLEASAMKKIQRNRSIRESLLEFAS